MIRASYNVIVFATERTDFLCTRCFTHAQQGTSDTHEQAQTPSV